LSFDAPESKQMKFDENTQDYINVTSKNIPLSTLLDDLRKIPGFPLGTNENILAISDPPYFTACPNPYIAEYLNNNMLSTSAQNTYSMTPFEDDIVESKSGTIYYAHSYHTKVPHKAIMRYIQHYTKAGDVVFDGFCGTGMTGIAALLTGRRAVISDLSPAAAFISYGYNSGADPAKFKRIGLAILKEVEAETAWMFETIHTDGKTKGRINYTIYSDVLACPFCKNEHIYYNEAFQLKDNQLLDAYPCPHCGSEIKKSTCETVSESVLDTYTAKTILQKKQVPVLINYNVDKKRFDKIPDDHDLALLKKIENEPVPYWIPTDQIPSGDTSKGLISVGVTHVHHIYPKKNLWIFASLYDKILKSECKQLLFVLSAINIHITKRRIFQPDKPMGTPALPGTLFIPSISVDYSALGIFNRKLSDICKAYQEIGQKKCMVGIHSATDLRTIPSSSVDYIFTDPPFGSNLMYSELNFIWEAWMKVITSSKSEAIINKSQNKDLLEYKDLMVASFKEFNRILKPDHWITIEFHNSKASVWNAIQESITKAGFIIAQVSILDKKGHFKHAMSPGGVKNDLIINAYKPDYSFQYQILKRSGKDMEVQFIREHLHHLPIKPTLERVEQMLYSKMLAHYIQNGFEIEINARQFYGKLKDHFKNADGYWFLNEELEKYEEWKQENGLKAIEEIARGQQTLFVSDEKSMLIWLYNFLSEPKSFSDIYTTSRMVISSMEDELPELRELLETNFVVEDGKYRRPISEHERDSIEEHREKELQRVFDSVLDQVRSSNKKIKCIRKEALVHGFTKAYQEKRFSDIIAVAKRLDKEILESNSEINDFVEIAQLKVGEGI
jgi:DNA modification methylase